jgi:hypothetical protein
MAITVGALYHHYKGTDYRVIALGLHSETKEPLVVYQTLDARLTWVRPQAMFEESVVYNGQTIPRFTFIRLD